MRIPTFCLLAMSSVILGLGTYSQPASANLPTCSSASSDEDGDGYGWENNASCIVQAAGGSGDGNNASCIDTPPFDDDWGWDGSQSCRLSASGNDNTPQEDDATCVDTPPFDDNWGWNGSASCMLNASDNTGGGDSGGGNDGSGDNGNNAGECVDTPPFDDDWGWNGSASCLLSGNTTTPTEPTTPVEPVTPVEPTTPTVPPAPTLPTSGGRITSTFAPVHSLPNDTCLTRQDTLNGDFHGAIELGDFILSTNAWNASAAGDFDWEQCIYANQNGARVGWNYRWGAGGGPGDFNVRSYPELIYGVKSQGEISAPKSVTGLPVRIDQMPDITIDYSLASSEYGPVRAVSASVTPRFPNGTLIQGERNVAVESFLHPSDSNGNCGENVVQRGSGSSNHTYEVMVWIDSGAERLPSGPGDFVTTVTLGGQQYDVYTKSSDRKYVAFVARNPQLTGTLNWTAFIDWARQHAHRVQEDFGARVNSDQIQDGWCLANVLVGTEIWWGDGDMNIYEWQINQN